MFFFLLETLRATSCFTLYFVLEIVVYWNLWSIVQEYFPPNYIYLIGVLIIKNPHAAFHRSVNSYILTPVLSHCGENCDTVLFGVSNSLELPVVLFSSSAHLKEDQLIPNMVGQWEGSLGGLFWKEAIYKCYLWLIDSQNYFFYKIRSELLLSKRH